MKLQTKLSWLRFYGSRCSVATFKILMSITAEQICFIEHFLHLNVSWVGVSDCIVSCRIVFIRRKLIAYINAIEHHKARLPGKCALKAAIKSLKKLVQKERTNLQPI